MVLLLLMIYNENRGLKIRLTIIYSARKGYSADLGHFFIDFIPLTNFILQIISRAVKFEFLIV